MVDHNIGSYCFRNKIINGDMRIDQRNAGASFTAAASNIVYGIDRFYLYQLGAGVTGQRVSSGLTNFPYALRVTGATSNTYSEVAQRIESSNVSDLAGQNVTVSFYAAHSS
ncbi:MAG: hypothetical protein EB127_20040, partial [Alphaproteobacteria bacterium]|nr:hypothetical protein [Alphaproteobacteria bacterium]